MASTQPTQTRTTNSTMKVARRIAILLTLTLLAGPVSARSFNSFEATKKSDEAKEDVLRILEKIDPNGFYPLDETLGFKYAWRSRWKSPYNYTVFIQDLSLQKPVPIIRVEGNKGDVLSFSRVFTVEGIVKSETNSELVFRKLQPKSHAVAQGLNLLSPSLGVLYASYDSPSLSTGQTVARSLTYLGIDALLVWGVGRNGWRDRFDAGRRGGAIAAALMVPRIVSGFQASALVRGHNTFAEAGYTFALDSY